MGRMGGGLVLVPDLGGNDVNSGRGMTFILNQFVDLRVIALAC